MACIAHRTHHPTPLTLEAHHVVPQAWQQDQPRLWAPQTVTLCPTSHRNVHYWIVWMMKWMRDHGIDPDAAFRAAGSRTIEARIARRGIGNYIASGRDLQKLIDARELGYA